MLPADGYTGPVPDFPLVAPTKRELDLWAQLWRTPQATQWESMTLEVASYVRCLAVAEKPDATAAQWTLVRQVGDSLGLTKSGMLRNRWKIAELEQTAEAPASARVTARDRFKVVPGG